MKMRIPGRVLVCVMVVGPACGGSLASSEITGSADVSGTVSGETVPADNAITIDESLVTNGETITSRVISITSISNACQCNSAANEESVTLVVATVGTTIPAGTYSFPSTSTSPPPGAAATDAWYYVADPSLVPCCSNLVHATSGSVTLSEITASSTVGSFDLSFPSGDHLTGTFTAPICSSAPSADAGTCP